ncbi:ABC transporter permease [Plantibacter flavus]|uniref:ABC transporter permease n=1 Tax=Plantibacter flavus TaxID=150123 RepID=UPI003F15D084
MTTLSAQARTSVITRSWRTPIGIGIVAIIAVVLLVAFGRDGQVVYALRTGDTDSIVLPPVVVGVRAVGVGVALIAALIASTSAILTRTGRKTPLWMVGAFIVVVLFGFLTWATAGNTVPVAGLLAGSLALSVPLIFGALGGVISERVGVVNVAIEGQLLAGAFVSALVASVTQNLFAGLLAALVAGALVSFVLAAFSIKYLVDQVIVGVVVNVLVLGLTSFLYSNLLAANAAALNSPPQFLPIAIPLLSAIPVIGPVLFNQTVIVYAMYLAVLVVFFCLYQTRWGLRVRAVGEHPQAADTVGINVNGTRFWNVLLAGAVAGFGGAYFTLGSVGAFSKDITSGAGFIALAAVIFGQWNPLRAALAALLFGFATNLQYVLGQLAVPSPVPTQFLLMLPYLVTMVALAGLIGRSRGPAAVGKPYTTS